jgi:hypothetical protein
MEHPRRESGKARSVASLRERPSQSPPCETDTTSHPSSYSLMPINQFGIVRAGRFRPFRQPFLVRGDCRPMLSRIPARKAFRMKPLRHLKAHLLHFQIIAQKKGQDQSADKQIRPVSCSDSASFGFARRCSRTDPRCRFSPDELTPPEKRWFSIAVLCPPRRGKTPTGAHHPPPRARTLGASVVLPRASHRQHSESL